MVRRRHLGAALAHSLLSLSLVSSSDLGTHVLSSQLLRENVGLGISPVSVDISQERIDDFYEDEEDELEDEDGLMPSASALVSKDDFRHGLSPESWGSQERFFFTVPQQRRRRPPPPPPTHDKFFVGDQSQCSTGSCEFFLFCWLGGGVVEGGCGGFLQSCCNRPNQVGAKTIVTQDNFAHPTVNWGPIVNDQRCGISAVRRNVAQRRIVGGDEAGFGTFPWQAYIRIGTSRCGGSLGMSV